VLTVFPPVDFTVTAEALGVRKLEQSRVSLRFNQKPRAEITRFRVEAFNLFNHLRFVEPNPTIPEPFCSECF